MIDSDNIPRDMVIDALKAAGFSSYIVLRNEQLTGYYDSKKVAEHLAAIWRRVSHSMQGIVISIEHDVMATPEDYSALVKTLEERDKTTGIVGAPLLGRHGGHVMVYRNKSIVPTYSIDRRRLYTNHDGVKEVGSVSLGLTAIRAEVARACDWAGCPNPDGTGGNGHEWSLMRHCALLEIKVLCNWDIRPKHHKTADEFLQYSGTR